MLIVLMKASFRVSLRMIFSEDYVRLLESNGQQMIQMVLKL